MGQQDPDLVGLDLWVGLLDLKLLEEERECSFEAHLNHAWRQGLASTLWHRVV
jgi:hypothetical protein